MECSLLPLRTEDLIQFKKDMQEAFRFEKVMKRDM